MHCTFKEKQQYLLLDFGDRSWWNCVDETIMQWSNKNISMLSMPMAGLNGSLVLKSPIIRYA